MFATNIFNGYETVKMNANGTGSLKFMGDGTVTIADDVTWTGGISTATTGTGTLVLMEDTLTVSNSITSNTIKAINVANDTGDTAIFNSDVNALTIGVGSGTATFNVDTDSNLNFTDDGEIIIADGYSVDGSVDSESDSESESESESEILRNYSNSCHHSVND